MSELTPSFSVFADFRRRLHVGADLDAAVEAGRRAYRDAGAQTVVLFDDLTGDRTEIDPRPGEPLPLAWRRSMPGGGAPRHDGPGRPKLGVVAREVTLLPRHWEWLATQPGGASATLRKLVDEARAKPGGRARTAADAAYRFLSVFGGDLPRFEDAARALYAGRFDDAAACLAEWPDDLREHARGLLAAARDSAAR